MSEIEKLKIALEREKSAREAAEKIVEEKSAELRHFNEELKELNQNLEKEIARRTLEVKILALFPEEIPDPVLRISKNGQIVYANPASQTSLLPYFNLQIGDSYPAIFKSSIQEVLQTGLPVSKEYVIDNAHFLIYFSGLKELNYINMLARDISDIKRTQEQLEQSEKRYRQIIESASDIIYRIDAEGYFTYINPTAIRLLNHSEEELMLMHYTRLVHPRYRKKVEKFYAFQISKKTPNTYLEFPIVLQTGKEMWIGQNVQITLEGNKITELTALARDITDRKMAEEALHLTSSRLSTLIKSMHTAVIVEDENRKIVLVNEKFCMLFGLSSSPKEMIGEDFGTKVQQFKSLFKNTEGFEEEMNEILNKKDLNVGKEIITLDGRVLERDYVPISAGSQFLGHLWQYRDITEKRKSEAKLVKSQKAFLEAQELANLGNWEYNLQTKELNASKQFYRQIGREKTKKIIVKDYLTFFQPEELKHIQEEIKKSFTSGYSSFETQIKRPDGEIRYLQISLKPEFSPEGTAVSLYGTSLDITELRKAEEQLKESEERFTLAVQGTNDGIWDWYLPENRMYFSPQWKRMLGYEDHELPNEYATWVQLLHPKEKEKIQKVLNNFLKNRDNLLSFETRMLHKDGRYRNIMSRGISVRNSSGKAIRLVGSNSDITERKSVEKHIFKSLKQQKLLSDISFLFSTVVDDLQDPITQAIEMMGLHTDVSRVYIFENSADDVFTTNTFEWCNKGIPSQIDELENIPYSVVPSWKKKLMKGGIISSDIRELPEDIQEILEPQKIKAVMIFPIFVMKHFVGFVGFDDCFQARQWEESEIQLLKTFTNLLGNVFERQSTERQLLVSEEKYRSVVDNLTEVIFQTDEKSFLTFLNPAWTDITGYSLNESLGQNLLDYIYPIDRIDMDELYELLIDQKIDFCKETLRINHKNNEIRWIEIFARVTLDQFNQIEGISGTINDVTDRKLAEEALILAKEQAEQASLAKAQFLSTMSHEIRTPMNAVTGITNLLLKHQPRPDQIKNLNLLKFSGENLLHLLNDILDFSKIEAGKVTFEEVNFNIKLLLSGVKQSLGIRAEEKDIILRMLMDDKLPDMLSGDPTRLSQVLNNLVGNAIKFTEKGSVILTVDVIKESPEGFLLEFCVTDTGIGIPPENLENIFDSFSQASSDTTRKYGGTGLGLTITKKLLDMQGSQIKVESETGKGSKFFFQLTFKASNSEPEEESYQTNSKSSQSLQGQHILLVEDNLVNVVVASQFLEDWGAEIMVAENGAQALLLLKEHTFGLVLMDLQMPVMDGFEATRHIREIFTAEKLPVIALTADARQGIREQIAKVGMNDYISKPFIPDELYKKITRYLYPSHSHKVAAVEPVLEPLAAPAENLNAPETEAPALYTFDNLLEQSGGNMDFLKRMVSIFLQTTPATLTQIEENLKNGELESLQGLAHKIKPSIDILEIKDQKDKVRLIEKMPPDTFSSNEGKEMIIEFIETIRKVCDQIQKDPFLN